MKVPRHLMTSRAQRFFRPMERRGSGCNCAWQFHPGFQISHVLKGASHRIVGDDTSALESEGLAFPGPALIRLWVFDMASDCGVASIARLNLGFRQAKKANPAEIRGRLNARNCSAE